MSIKTTWTNTLPMPLKGMAVTMEVNAVEPFIEEDDYDVCVCSTCDYSEDAFVNTGGEWWKNDFKSILAKRKFASDTVTFKLLKSGVVVATLNASTYGTYYNFGDAIFVSLPNVNFPDYKGFIVDWALVQAGFGYGSYKLRVETVSLGVTYTKDTHAFNVVEYNAYRADGSVRIESYQNGNLTKRWDYTGLNWPQMTRIKGMFGNKKPTLVIDNYEDANRQVHEIQGKIEDTYYLNTELLKAEIFNYLNYNGLRGNTLLITDYNLQNQELYRRKSVYLTNFEDVENHVKTRLASFYYAFKDKVNNDIKRNAYGDGTTFNGGGVGAVSNGGNVATLYGEFELGDTAMGVITISSANSGTYTSITDDGASGTITVNKNSAGFVAFSSPLVLIAGDTLNVQRTVATAEGWYRLIGTF